MNGDLWITFVVFVSAIVLIPGPSVLLGLYMNNISNY